MHTEILDDRQKTLLPVIGQFKKEYYLVGGTAIALYIGHRCSIDFDSCHTMRMLIIQRTWTT